MTAVRQVRNVGFWIFPDVMMADPERIIDDSPQPGELLVLGWTGGDGNDNQVIYRLVDMSSGLKRLQREHYIDADPTPDTITIVAEYIDDEIDPMTGERKTNCYRDGAVLKFTVTANVGGQTKTQEYEVKPRVGT
jgi:hypothetical protein